MNNCKYAFRIVLFSFTICILFAFSGSKSHAESVSEVKLEGKSIYLARTTADITYDKAIENLANILAGGFGPFGIRYYGKPNLLYFAGRDELGELLLGGTRFAFNYDNKQQLTYVLFKSISLTNNRLILSPQLSVRLKDLDYQPVEVIKVFYEYKFAVYAGPLSFHFKKKDVASQFADMLYAVQIFMRTPTDEEQKQAAEFEAAAARYRELTIKPEISEEQRKYVVQANALTNLKDYEGAIEIYLKAVKIDPVSYPGAYSNLALLYAQLKSYDEAISYMKKYLMLVPDAQDARGAQDKIYEWEIMKKKQAS